MSLYTVHLPKCQYISEGHLVVPLYQLINLSGPVSCLIRSLNWQVLAIITKFILFWIILLSPIRILISILLFLWKVFILFYPLSLIDQIDFKSSVPNLLRFLLETVLKLEVFDPKSLSQIFRSNNALDFQISFGIS